MHRGEPDADRSPTRRSTWSTPSSTPCRPRSRRCDDRPGVLPLPPIALPPIPQVPLTPEQAAGADPGRAAPADPGVRVRRRDRRGRRRAAVPQAGAVRRSAARRTQYPHVERPRRREVARVVRVGGSTAGAGARGGARAGGAGRRAGAVAAVAVGGDLDAGRVGLGRAGGRRRWCTSASATTRSTCSCAATCRGWC